jgi:hypothetical protein
MAVDLQSGGHGVDAAKFGPLVHLGVVVLPNAVGVLDDGADVTDEEGVEAEPHGDGEHGGPDLGDGGGVEVAGLGALRQQAGEAGVCAEGVLLTKKGNRKGKSQPQYLYLTN